MTLPSGFPSGTGYTPVPHPFFGPLLEQFQDLEELKCALRVLFLLNRKRGTPRFVTFQEVAADVPLARALGGEHYPATLKGALEGCVRLGVFLRLGLQRQGETQVLYFLNTPASQQAIERIRQGTLTLPAFPQAEPVEEASPRHSIFQLYESTIGIITAPVAEELKDAEQHYPPPWIEEAFQEAAQQNKRRWSYVQRLLQRWAAEGREHGASGRYPKKVPAKELFGGRRGYGPLAR